MYVCIVRAFVQKCKELILEVKSLKSYFKIFKERKSFPLKPKYLYVN